MKVFPETDCSIELSNDGISAISKLKNQTLSKNQFVADWNNQIFIGEVKENKFEIKLSNMFLGEFCVLKGKIENEKGILEIRTSKSLKMVFLAITFFCFSGIVLAIIKSKSELIFDFVMVIVVVRFVFMELGFRLVSMYVLNKLTEIIGIKK